jgi:hypothetical protein
MKLGERTVSYYEIMNGTGARWYWDVNYAPEAEQQEQEPPPATLLAAIDSALEKRVFLTHPKFVPKPLDNASIAS